MYFYIKIDLPFCDRVDKISKANSVQFENLSDYYSGMLEDFKSVEDLNVFRLSLYSVFKTKVRIDYVSFDDGGIIKNGFKLSSDILQVSDHILAQCVPYYIRKKYFGYNNFTRKYFSNCNLLYNLSYNE